MTCQECVNLLLESGRDEIVRADSSALGRHLMTCPRCRAVADGILGETTRVAALFGAERSKRKAKRGAATTLGLAGVILLGIGLHRSTSVALRHATTSMSTRMESVTVATLPLPKPMPSLGNPIATRPIVVGPIAPSRPMVAAVRQAATTAGDSQVSVAPPPGVQAAVFRTRNPNVTVVWLYQSSGEHP